MNNFIKLLFCGVLLLSGCATNQVRVTYYSDPNGAALYEGQKALGYTPFTLIYPISPQDKARGYVSLSPTKVVWASGASATVQSRIAELSKGTNFHLVFMRPDVPGRDVDLNFALQLERNRILQEQANAQRDQAFWQMYNAVFNQYQKSAPTYNRTNCTSNVIGNNIYTTCY
jgi:hypothetical protein